MGKNIDYTYLDKPIEDIVERKLAEKDGSGYNGGMDGGWKNSVDSRLKTLHEDMRMTWGALAAICALIIGLYVWSDQKFDGVSDKIYTLNGKASAIDGKLDTLIALQKSHK